MRSVRIVALACLAVAVLAAPARGEPDAEKQQCVARHAESQKLRRAGKLEAASKLLRQCADEACPAPVRAECAQWAQEVDASMPSIVVELVRPDGSLSSGASVKIDGVVRETNISGMPISLDPGEHQVEVRPKGGSPLSRKVLVVVDEKKRRVRFELPKPAPAPVTPVRQPEQGSGVPAATVALGSLGIVAIGVGGYFGYKAKTRADELDACAPNCDRGEADAMRGKALIADVSFGVGIVAIGIAAYVWLTHSNTRELSRFQPMTGISF